MAVAGGIGLGIAGLKTIRGKMAKVDAKTHADRIAMGMEQLEAGEGLNLRPHPQKGFNYHNSPDTTIQSPNGTIYSNAVVSVFDENYLNVDAFSSLRLRNSSGSFKPGLILVGSHVPLADDQLDILLNEDKCAGLELPVIKIANGLDNLKSNLKCSIYLSIFKFKFKFRLIIIKIINIDINIIFIDLYLYII